MSRALLPPGAGTARIVTARLGILMLDTAFPRPPGDIGNPASFGFPVRYARVARASARQAVLADPEALLADFIAEGRKLVAEGCTGLGTSCGFLAPLQAEMAGALGVPVAASALSLVPLVQAFVPPGKQVGVVTISAASLGARHLNAAGIATPPPIAGCDPEGVFARTILQDRPGWDAGAPEACVLDAAHRLATAHPDLGGIVLECTNMGPYSDKIRHQTGLPVWSVIDLLTAFHAGLPAAG